MSSSRLGLMPATHSLLDSGGGGGGRALQLMLHGIFLHQKLKNLRGRECDMRCIGTTG